MYVCSAITAAVTSWRLRLTWRLWIFTSVSVCEVYSNCAVGWARWQSYCPVCTNWLFCVNRLSHQGVLCWNVSTFCGILSDFWYKLSANCTCWFSIIVFTFSRLPVSRGLWLNEWLPLNRRVCIILSFIVCVSHSTVADYTKWLVRWRIQLVRQSSE